MAVSIDERVVEMRFNNKQFEEGVKQSMKSLDNLDKSIDNLDNKNLNSLVERLNKINFDAIENSVDSLNKKFSAFGVAGMTVIQDLTRGFEGLVGQMVRLVNKPLAQIKSGGWARAMNIENAKFQLKGLNVAWEKIEKDISYGVQDTAYGLDAAAKAASQLVASGVKFGETFGPQGSSPMAKALRGISGVAAMSNSAYEEISPIFTTIAGQGKVMTMQLRQLESRGLNAAAELGKYLGKTETEIREMVTKGKIDFQTFSTAMDDAFGQHAKDANETFSGSLSNMKAALSRIGADIGSNVLEKMVGVFNDLRKAINELHVTFQPFLDEINRWVNIVTAAIRVGVKWFRESEEAQSWLVNLREALIATTRSIAAFIITIIKYSKPLHDNLKAIATILFTIIKTILGINENASPLEVFIRAIGSLLKYLLVTLNAITYVIRSILEYITNSSFTTILSKITPFIKVLLPILISYLILSKFHLMKVALAIGAIGAAIALIIKFDVVGKIRTMAIAISDLAVAIYDDLTSKYDTIKAFFTGIINGAIDAKDKIAEFIQSLQESNGGFVEALREKLEVVYGFMKGFIGGIKPGITLLYALTAAVMFAAYNITTAIKNLSTIAKGFSPFAWLNSIGKGIETMLTDLGKAERMQAAAKIIATMAASILALSAAAAIIANVVDPNVFMVITAAITVMIAALTILVGVLGNVAKKLELTGFDAAANIIGSGGKKALEDLGKGAKALLRAFSVSVVLHALATSILLVTGALVGLAIASTKYDIPGALKVLGLLFAGIAGFTVLVRLLMIKLDKASDLAVGIIAIGGAMAALAGALLIMSYAIERFQKIQIASLKLDAILLMIGTAAALGGAVVLLSVIMKEATFNILSFLAVAVGLAIVLYQLPPIVNGLVKLFMESGETIKQILIAYKDLVPYIIAIAAIAVAAIMYLSKFVDNVVQTLVLLGGVMLEVMKFFEWIGSLSGDQVKAMSDAMVQLQDAIGYIMILMAIVIAASALATHALGAAMLLMSIPLSIIAMIGAFKIAGLVCKTFTVDEFIEALTAIGITAFALWGLSKLVKGFQSDWKSLLALPVVILTLSACIGLLALVTKDVGYGAVFGGALALSMALVAFGFMMGKLQKSLATIKIPTLLVLLVGLAAIIGAIGVVVYEILRNNADIGTILSIFGGLALVIGSVAAIFAVLAKYAQTFKRVNGQTLASIIAVLALVVGSIIPAVIAIGVLSQLGTSWVTIAVAAGAIAGILIAISAAVSILAKSMSQNQFDEKQAKSIAGIMIALAFSMIEVAIALSLLQNGNINSMLVSMIPILALFGTLIGAFVLLSTMVENGQIPELKKIAPALVSIAALAGVMVIVSGAIATILNAAHAIDFTNGIVILTNLGLLIGEIFAMVITLSKLPMSLAGAAGMIAAAAGMILIAHAIVVMSDALAKLVSMDFQSGKLWEAAKSIALLVGVLGGFVALMGALTTVPVVIAGIIAAAIALGGVFLAMGISIKWVCDGISSVISSIAELVTAIADAAVKTGESMDDIVLGIETAIEHLIVYIEQHAEEIGGAIKKIFESAGIDLELLGALGGLAGGGLWAAKNTVKGWKMIGEELYNLTGKYRDYNHEKELTEGSSTGRKHTGASNKDDLKYVQSQSAKIGAYGPKSIAKGSDKNIKLSYKAGKRNTEAYVEGEKDGADTHSLSPTQMEIGAYGPKSIAAGSDAEVAKGTSEDAGTRNGESYVAGEESVLNYDSGKEIAQTHMDGVRDAELEEAKKIKQDTNKAYRGTGIENANMLTSGTEEGLANANPLEEYIDRATEQAETAGEVTGETYAESTASSTSETLATETPKTLEDWVQLAKDVASGNVSLMDAAGTVLGSGFMSGFKDSLSMGPVEDLISNITNVMGGSHDYSKMMTDITGTRTWNVEANKIRANYRSLNEKIDQYSKIGDPNQRARALADLPYTIKKTSDEIDDVINTTLYNRYEHDKAFREKVYTEYKESTTGMLEDMLNSILGIEDVGDIEMPEFDQDFDPDGITGGLNDITQSARNATEAFNSFDRTVTLTAKDMIVNLKDNLLATTEWEQGIETLRKKGLNSKMITEFISSGVEGSYQQVAALSKASKKQIKTINTIKEALESKNLKLADAFDDKGNLKKSYLKYLDGIKIPKDFDMGLKDWSKVTGKKLNKAFREAFGKIDMKDLTKGSKVLSKALNEYIEASNLSAEKATKKFKKYLKESYLASLDEAEKQEFLAKKKKEQEKDITAWYKQQVKERKEAIAAEIRAQDDLAKQRTKTGKEYRKELTKRNKDAKEVAADRQVLSMLFKNAGYKDAADEILTQLDESSLLALLDDWMEAGGESAGEAYYKGMAKKLTGNKAYLDEMQQAFEMAYGKSGTAKDRENFVDKYIKDITHLKDASEVLIETLEGIQKGVTKTITSDKKLSKTLTNIANSFTFDGSTTGIEAATAALENYALGLLDMEEIEKEAAVTGADSAELIKSHLEDVSKALLDFKDSVASSLKSTLQSFDAFDEGEKKSLDEMVKNLQNNVTKVNEWRANLKRMAELGYSTDIIKHMTEQGISSFSEVAALTAGSVTSGQVNEINRMWQQIGTDSETAADEALGAVVTAVGNNGEDTVKAYIDGVNAKKTDAEKATTNVVISAAMAANDAIQGEMLIIKQTVKTATDEIYSTMAKEVDDQTARYREIVAAKMNASKALLNAGYSLDQVNSMWKTVGLDSVQGYLDGLTSPNAKNLVNSGVQGLAFSIISNMMKELDIHSPSKVFRWMGEMCMDGLSMGFEDGAYSAEDAIISYTQRLLNDIQEITDSDSEWEIKPVLNLDDLQNANSLIQSMLGNGDIAVRSTQLASQASTQSNWDMLSKALSGIGTTTETNTYGDTQIIVNPPQGSNSREIAQMVMSEIQRQMDRRQRI